MTFINILTLYKHVQHKDKHNGTIAFSPCPCICITSSHTPGCPVAECDEENEAAVKQHHRTGYLIPSSLDPAPLRQREKVVRRRSKGAGFMLRSLSTYFK